MLPHLRSALRRFSVITLMLGALGLPLTRAQTEPVIYVSSRDLQAVDAVASDGSVSVFASGNLLQSAEGITRDTAGNLYVSHAPGDSSNSITKITPAGVMSNFVTLGANYSPTALAFDSSGNLFAGSQSNPPAILKIASGGGISVVSSSYNDINRPWGLAFDHLDNLYVASLNKNTITKFTPDGTSSVFATLPVDSVPAGLTFDSQGNLYVSYLSSTEIDKITPDGDVSDYYSGPFGGLYTTDIAMAESGYLYALESNNHRIVEIAPGGASASVFASLADFPSEDDSLVLTSPAVYAVPEPATYAALAGLAALGLAAFRRRRV